ncbi:Choline/Carnitine o-acyltransferase-domain-containing protein [Entophlyctis helioformis]|nr:Choline/Carnitine o-acyltransferase-domain-containing protein [Entophlyctis helioformis]
MLRSLSSRSALRSLTAAGSHQAASLSSLPSLSLQRLQNARAISSLRHAQPAPAIGAGRALKAPAAPAAAVQVHAAQHARHMSSQSTLDTFANQDKVPRLPVPSLDAMAAKYLASCKPVLSPDEFEATKAAVEQFISPAGLGPVLQQRLIEYERKQPNSWLEDIWLNKAYLEYREPAPINSNWWCAFINHPNHPKDLLHKPPPKGVMSSFQVQRAAGLITNALNFKEILDSGNYPPEYARDTPLCMNQYRNMFGTTRIPGAPADTVKTAHPAQAKHIVVLARDQIYKVDVIRENGVRVPLKEIERLLFAVGQDSQESESQPPIGLLTAGHRDTWAKAYSHMQSLSQANRDSFSIINDALFAVSLDDHASHHNINSSHHQIFHNYDGSNRWFDKAISLIVSSSGQAGVNGEHSPADAVVPGNLMNFMVSHEPAVDPDHTVASPPLPAPTKLKWVVDDQVEALLADARKTIKDLIDDTESCLLQTDVYGGRFIKEVAKSSPDAYVQIALQLAYYRLHGDVTPMYESASTRKFLHGRTETGRSTSSESVAFVKAFDDDEILYDDKRRLFAQAVATQSTYMKEAAAGQGIDRHLLGLRCMLKDEEKALPSLFTDPAYIKSMTFRLSTSNMSPGDFFYGGFGPVVTDGYGINYAIGKDDLKLSMSHKKSAGTTDCFKFRSTLERTLVDMFILFPKRTEVWGYGWEAKHEAERKEAHFLKRMRKLSDDYRAKQAVFADRYKNRLSKSSTAESS